MRQCQKPERADPGAVSSLSVQIAVSDSVSAASRRQQLADLRGNETSFAEHSSTLAFERRQSMSASLMHHCLHQPLLAGPRHSLLRQCTPDATSLTSLQWWHTAKQLHPRFFHLCFRLSFQCTAERFSALTSSVCRCRQKIKVCSSKRGRDSFFKDDFFQSGKDSFNDAKDLFAEGEKLFKKGDFQQGQRLFQQAEQQLRQAK